MRRGAGLSLFVRQERPGEPAARESKPSGGRIETAYERRAALVRVLAEAVARVWIERSLSGREVGLPSGGTGASMRTPPNGSAGKE